ncbi:cupin domain-containing protein [Variovorax sp. HJSM1_2]|uniref:AraC family transcriptional regulator n=1 Tax=Variovorax sp. HJSM1_2 TaxID=3366263 RepID=UPI003BE9BCFA
MSTATSSSDLIGLVLGTLRTERASTARFTLSAPWSLRSDGVEGLLIRVSLGEPYWIEADGAEPVLIQPGDIVLLPQGAPHIVRSARELAPLPFSGLLAQHMSGAHGDHPITFRHGGEGGHGAALTELFSLHLWMPQHRGQSLLSWLPPLIVLRAAEVATTRTLALATQALVDETLTQVPGWQLVTARMADLLLVHVLRAHLQSGAAQAQGWLAGIGDKAIGKALAQMHANPELPWSVASLSRVSHQSRSVFSERFVQRMGTTPMRYLADVRMGIASQQFEQGQADVARVAQDVGYASEKAFSRAFERWAGQTPSQYLKLRTNGAQIRRHKG